MSIWLVGSKGMLGTDMARLLESAGCSFAATDLETDITRGDQIRSYAREELGSSLEWIINCSAYTQVDRAEDEPEAAHKINADGVTNLAHIAKDHDATLIHISTDYVFDGLKPGAYDEEDEPCPTGVYGKTKLEGELRIRGLLDRHFILRTSWLYGKYGKNFVSTMLRLFREREEVKVVADQWGSPTYTVDLAGVILGIIQGTSDRYGTYHYSNEGRTNWFEFAGEIYRLAREKGIIDRDVEVLPITADEYPTKAARPPNSYLSKDKIKKELGVTLRYWGDALNDYLDAGEL